MSYQVQVDPVLTVHAQGYRHPDHVGHLLFPRVDTFDSSGKVLEFGRESFTLYNARRVAGAATKRIDFGVEGKPYTLVQDSLESKVPREYQRDAAKDAKIDLGIRASDTVMRALTLTLENEQAAIATNAANYPSDHKVTLSGTSQWSHASSTPVDDIETARQVIRASCGLYPNIAIAGPKSYSALKNSVQVVNRFRNSDVITSKMLSALLEIDTIAEGRAVVSTALGGFQDVWGDYFVLGYAPPKPSGMEEPSYGYTYTMVGHPFVEKSYYDGNTKSNIYGVTYERVPVLTGMSVGYLFSDTSAE